MNLARYGILISSKRGKQKQPRWSGVPKGKARTPDNTKEQDKGIVRRAEALRYFKACRGCGETSWERKEIGHMRYNLSKIMLKAWSIYRKGSGLSFGECLHRAWLSDDEDHKGRLPEADQRDDTGWEKAVHYVKPEKLPEHCLWMCVGWRHRCQEPS